MASKIPCVELQTGQKMPVIGMGTFKVKHDEARVAFNAALECGYRHIDTAYMYFNEEVIGEVLSAWFESGRLKREDVFITTKLPLIGNRKEDVSHFLQKSLDWMRISYVDLYLIHSPIGLKRKDDMDAFALSASGECSLDLETNLEDLWKGMEAQVDSGKAKAIGLSNFNSKQIERIMTASRIKPAIHQVEVHAHHLQKPLRKVCEQNGIIVCGYAPLGAPYKHEDEGLVLLKNPVVSKIAAHHKKTNAQVLLRYLIQLNIIIIPKSSNAERLKQNLEVFDFELTAEEMAELDSLDQGKKGKLFTYSNFKGVDKHPEFPFHIPY